ncbi:MAG: YggT family protein [Dehalococcoidia bacterium]|jgi:YggT family protein|nr:YggT family protein [Chloroflexota bacterium]MCZ6867183.1 YggT family protein [Chloroflexota bacterium]
MLALINLLLLFLQLAIFARIIVSWIAPRGGLNNPIVNVIYQITEPILGPLRRILPRVGMFDFSPMVAIIIIVLIQSALGSSG